MCASHSRHLFSMYVCVCFGFRFVRLWNNEHFSHLMLHSPWFQIHHTFYTPANSDCSLRTYIPWPQNTNKVCGHFIPLSLLSTIYSPLTVPCVHFSQLFLYFTFEFAIFIRLMYVLRCTKLCKTQNGQTIKSFALELLCCNAFAANRFSTIYFELSTPAPILFIKLNSWCGDFNSPCFGCNFHNKLFGATMIFYCYCSFTDHLMSL